MRQNLAMSAKQKKVAVGVQQLQSVWKEQNQDQMELFLALDLLGNTELASIVLPSRIADPAKLTTQTAVGVQRITPAMPIVLEILANWLPLALAKTLLIAPVASTMLSANGAKSLKNV